jgi:hypothetical protein
MVALRMAKANDARAPLVLFVGALALAALTGILGTKLVILAVPTVKTTVWLWLSCALVISCMSFLPIKSFIQRFNTRKSLRAFPSAPARGRSGSDIDIGSRVLDRSLDEQESQRDLLFGSRRPGRSAGNRVDHENLDDIFFRSQKLDDRLRRAVAMPLMTQPSSKALGLFEGVPPFQLYDDDGKPWCLPVLRTEAALRLSADYLEHTGKYFDIGCAPPAALSEDVECLALQAHGFAPAWLEAYRFAARMLPQKQREEFFFLRANDSYFRPGVDLCGLMLQGALLTPDLGSVLPSDTLGSSRTLLIASTSS